VLMVRVKIEGWDSGFIFMIYGGRAEPSGIPAGIQVTTRSCAEKCQSQMHFRTSLRLPEATCWLSNIDVADTTMAVY